MTEYKDMEIEAVATVAIAPKSAYEIERNKPIPSKNHAIVQGNIYFELRSKYEKQYKAVPEISIVIAEKERVPDVGIFKKLAYTPGNDDIRVSETPIGVIEILSPTQALGDLVTKSVKYFEEGIQSYWLVLPDLKTIFVFDQPDEYEVYSKRQQLVDKILDIKLELADILNEDGIRLTVKSLWF